MKTLVDKEIKRDEWSVPSMKVDVELIAAYFADTLGATRSDHCGSDSGLDAQQNVPWSRFKT